MNRVIATKLDYTYLSSLSKHIMIIMSVATNGREPVISRSLVRRFAASGLIILTPGTCYIIFCSDNKVKVNVASA